jgi:hypothetical protein
MKEHNNKSQFRVTGWGMLIAFGVCFVLFVVTKSNLIGFAGDIFLIIAVVAGIRNHLRSRRERA